MADEPKTADWSEASKEAKKWLKSLNYGRQLDGQTVDLTEPAKSLPHTGDFRRQVLNAAKRKLRKRGAAEVILPSA